MVSTATMIGRTIGNRRILDRRRANGVTELLAECTKCGATAWVQHQTLMRVIRYDVEHCAACNPHGKTHGRSRTRMLRRWSQLRQAGTMCDAWRTFPAFLADAGDIESLTSFGPVDRDRPCGPDNVRFDRVAKKAKIWLTIDGVSYSQADAAKLLGVSRERARQLYNKGRLADRLREVLGTIALYTPSEEIPRCSPS